MVAQLSFNFDSIIQVVDTPDKKLAKKRVRYKVPTYLKFYSLYRYDRNKFKMLMKEWLQTPEGINRTYKDLVEKQNEILEKCYKRDKDGKKLRDSDEPHIFRIQTLHKIYSQIFGFVGFIYRGGKELILDYDEEEAYLNINDLQMSIKERVIIHIRFFRLLRWGYPVKDAFWVLTQKGLYKEKYYKYRQKVNNSLKRKNRND